MSVKSFKFVSPGVFIHEIDNSFIPKSADAIGPVVIGRARRGIAMQPMKVQSYSDFVTMFGETVPGGGSPDVYRDGNSVATMYGGYAAKAFLRANVAPLTYVRLLGHQSTTNDGTAGALAGWKTANNAEASASAPGLAGGSSGGAYGLWVFPSASVNTPATGDTNAGRLAAVWYIDTGSIYLSGAVRGGLAKTGSAPTDNRGGGFSSGIGKMIGQNDSSNEFTVLLHTVPGKTSSISFSLDDTKETFIRNRFNTNPQLGNTNASDFFPSNAEVNYWLGETYEQDLRWELGDTMTNNNGLQGCIMAIASGSSMGVGTGPQYMKGVNAREGVAGWFISQDTGLDSDYVASEKQKIFRLKGRGLGEWLHKNIKVSIEKIRSSTTTDTQYGTFSVVLRKFTDTDSNVVVMERFDQCTLNPTSPNFVAKKIGDQYTSWDTAERRLKLYGDYPNQSKFVYVEMNADIEAGATDPTFLPFGYFGPPKYSDLSGAQGNGKYGGGLSAPISASYVRGGVQVYNTGYNVGPGKGEPMLVVSGGGGTGSITPADFAQSIYAAAAITASFNFPKDNLRLSASDGGLSDPADAYFGFQTTRTATSTRSDRSAFEPLRLLDANIAGDPTTSTKANGLDRWGYMFSLDNVVQSGSTNFFYYLSGSRSSGSSYTSGSYKDLLDAGYDSFTAPFWGGFDGFDIMKPDPMYNAGMSDSSTNDNNYIYYTWKRAIDTVSDPEAVDMNLLTAPGLTLAGLTGHMIDVCENRADALALIDLPNVYIPPHEAYKSTKKARIGTTPTQAAIAVKDRRIDSSYGCTFYPWVQTVDEATGQQFWVPPTVAMMGVLASSESKSQIWFAPAGFNRGGLTDGAGGIPVTGISEKLSSEERDTLYDAAINPIASFPATGIVVFGQKTLQERRSALDRINVRRLVIYLKKQISILSTQILFEQNVQATWNRFKSLIEPFLANVKVQFGITDYKLILDESTTTPDLIDQNILYAKIMIKPARAIEYIAIDFVIMSTGASFDD
jgi:hypothetical protein